MSVEEYKLLMERSTMYLGEAREALDKGRYDISVFLAEQGLQLFLKAQLLKVLGDYPRTQSVRGLLALLGRGLGDQWEEEIRRFMKRFRANLSELEDVYITARYTLRRYTREDAEDILRTAKEVIRFVEDLLRRALGGAERTQSST